MSKKKKHLQKEILDSYLKKITPLVKKLMVKPKARTQVRELYFLSNLWRLLK